MKRNEGQIRPQIGELSQELTTTRQSLQIDNAAAAADATASIDNVTMAQTVTAPMAGSLESWSPG